MGQIFSSLFLGERIDDAEEKKIPDSLTSTTTETNLNSTTGIEFFDTLEAETDRYFNSLIIDLIVRRATIVAKIQADLQVALSKWNDEFWTTAQSTIDHRIISVTEIAHRRSLNAEEKIIDHVKGLKSRDFESILQIARDHHATYDLITIVSDRRKFASLYVIIRMADHAKSSSIELEKAITIASDRRPFEELRLSTIESLKSSTAKNEAKIRDEFEAAIQDMDMIHSNRKVWNENTEHCYDDSTLSLKEQSELRQEISKIKRQQSEEVELIERVTSSECHIVLEKQSKIIEHLLARLRPDRLALKCLGGTTLEEYCFPKQ